MEGKTEGNNTKSIPGLLSLTRLERITEIFYAFALLLLMFTFSDVPDDLTASERWKFYFEHLQTFSGFLINFLIVAYYWISHQEYSSYFSATDKAHNMLELVYLMCLVFLPLSNYFYTKYPDSIETRIILSIDMVVLGVMQFFSWSYATKDRRLIGEKEPDDETISAIRWGMLHMPILAIVSAAAVFIYPYLWEVILVVGPIALTARKKTASRNSN